MYLNKFLKQFIHLTWGLNRAGNCLLHTMPVSLSDELYYRNTSTRKWESWSV